MGVLKDYMCTEHGVFESREAKCPIKFCKGGFIGNFSPTSGYKVRKDQKKR